MNAAPGLQRHSTCVIVTVGTLQLQPALLGWSRFLWVSLASPCVGILYIRLLTIFSLTDP